MKIHADRSRCQGHAMCNAAAPSVFPLDDLGYTTLDGDIEVPEGLDDQARRGVNSCPERVFTVVDG
ncbi:MAG TPA: ferredoxin [Acidimicrobiales bacterium]|nr:ferredoxin [Acidimicrobiales bacterium]